MREGDAVSVGQVLADRVRDRQRLETQKEQLQLQITQLQSPIAPLAAEHPVPEVAALPSPSFLGEVAEVEPRVSGDAGDLEARGHQNENCGD